MAFIILGTSTQLQIKVPTVGSTDWAATLQTDTFLKIAQHNHTGSGNGEKLGTGALLDSAITGAKFRLDNLEYLRARNGADSADQNLFRLNLSDELEIVPTIVAATINTLTSPLGIIDSVNSSKLEVKDTIALSDAEAGASVGVTTLTAGQAIKIEYRLLRNGIIETGSLEYDFTSLLPIQEFSGTSVGVTFSINAGDLEYVSTSTGNAPSFEYFEVRK